MTHLAEATEDTNDFTKLRVLTTEKKREFGLQQRRNNKGEEIRTLRITTDSPRAAVKTCHSRTPTKKVKCDGIFFYSFYIRGLILSLSKGEGYRTHTLVKEI